MANSAKIRTMRDDIDEAKKDLEEQTRQQQKPQVMDIAEESIKKQPLRSKSIQSDQSSSRQAAGFDARQPEKNSAILPKEDRKPIFISPEKPIALFSKKINAAEDNEIKDLVKRISDETDKDSYDDKNLTKKETSEKNFSQTEKTGQTASETIDKNKGETEAIIEKTTQEIIDDLAEKNDAKKKNKEAEAAKKSMEEMETLKKDLNKIEAEEKIREAETAKRSARETEVLEKNTKEVEDLKKMIGRISESAINAEKKAGDEIRNMENKEAEAAKKSMEEMETLKKDLNKIEAEEKIREAETAKRSARETEVLEKNTKEVEDLKKMIGRISESAINAEKKAGDEIDNVKKSNEATQKNGAVKPLARQHKQNIQQSSQITGVKKVEDMPVSIPSSEKEGGSFWKNVLEQIKKTDESRKINDLKNENLIPKIKTGEEGKFEKYSEQSGVLQNNSRQKEEPDKKSLPKKVYNENYTPPAERLARGKQELYSSVVKKVKAREEKGEMESLKNTVMLKNRRILSKNEEYEKLKRSIARKYHIQLFPLPWKKIISAAIIALATTGVVSYFVFSRINPHAPISNPPVIAGDEIQKFSVVEKKIIISRKDFEGFNNLESEAFNIFNSDENIKAIKLLIVNSETDRNILPLPEALDSIGIINAKENTNYLPDGFLRAAANNYNIFIFKTEKKAIRYGLAIKTNNKDSLSSVMRAWEKEEAKNKKMSAVLKPLFVNDKNFGDNLGSFSASLYKNIEIRYVHLVNKDTALNYFFYEDVLVFTTSKETAFTMVDFLITN